MIVIDPPERINMWDWIAKNIDCDAIIKRDMSSDDMIYVFAVSKGKPDRVSLKQYYKEKNYDDSYFILQGMTSSEVNRIFGTRHTSHV